MEYSKEQRQKEINKFGARITGIESPARDSGKQASAELSDLLVDTYVHMFLKTFFASKFKHLRIYTDQELTLSRRPRSVWRHLCACPCALSVDSANFYHQQRMKIKSIRSRSKIN